MYTNIEVESAEDFIKICQAHGVETVFRTTRQPVPHDTHRQQRQSDKYTAYVEGDLLRVITCVVSPTIPAHWRVDYQYRDQGRIYRQFSRKMDLVRYLANQLLVEDEFLTKLRKLKSSTLREVTDTSPIDDENIFEEIRRVEDRSDELNIPVNHPELPDKVTLRVMGSGSNYEYRLTATLDQDIHELTEETFEAISDSFTVVHGSINIRQER